MIITKREDVTCPSNSMCKLSQNDNTKGGRRYVRFENKGDRCEFFVRFGK
jgi:hypothetical protein